MCAVFHNERIKGCQVIVGIQETNQASSRARNNPILFSSSGKLVLTDSVIRTKRANNPTSFHKEPVGLTIREQIDHAKRRPIEPKGHANDLRDHLNNVSLLE